MGADSHFLRCVVYYNDIPVGTICARIEKGEQENQRRLYLMTMGILAVRLRFLPFPFPVRLYLRIAVPVGIND